MLEKLFDFAPTANPSSIHSEHPLAAFNVGKRLRELIAKPSHTPGTEIVVVCIGTDRSTGDSLGPLTGTKLASLRLPVPVYGTLDSPVHATNLPSMLDFLNTSYSNPFLIAVDACLGRLQNIGYISLANGPLKPGAACHKDLPEVGNIHVTGVVNVGGFMEHMVLQSTRLNLVMNMAEIISRGISIGLRH